jgi:hypothetical protein
VTHDGSLISIVEMIGAQALVGADEFNQIYEGLATSLQTRMSRPGHSIQVFFNYDIEAIEKQIKDTLNPARQTAHRLNLELKDLFNEKERFLSEYCAEEKVFFVLWTRPASLTKEQYKKAMKEKQMDDFAKRHRMFQAGSFPPGARVWVLDETRKGKTEPVYQGPYQVVQRTSGGSYVLKDQNGIIGRNVPIHLLKLQKKKGMPDISDESLYFVNKIHQHRGIAGKREYLVEWKGIKNKTWEPEQNMVDYEVVRNYWRRVKKQDVKDKESMSPVRGV